MPNTTTKQIENLHRPLSSRLVLFCFFFLSIIGFGQHIPEEFKEKAETLVQLQPKTYEALDEELSKEKRDTTLLRFFADLAKEYDYWEGQAYALNQLGTVYRNTSQYQKAVDLHQDALAVAEKANSTELRVLSLNMLGVVYRRTDAIKTTLD